MNNFRIITLISCFIIGMVSCKKADLITYQGTTADIYLNGFAAGGLATTDIDSMTVSFAFASAARKDSVVKLLVRTMGKPSEIDRPFKIVATSVSTATLNSHYESLGTFTMRAGRVLDTAIIKLLRSADMVDSTFILQLQLLPNEHFTTNMQDRIINNTTGAKHSYVKINIKVTDIFQKPKLWMDYYLGVFSKKKMFLICEKQGIEPEYLNSLIAVGETVYYGSFMQQWLNDMARVYKTPVYEEDGVTLMIMGPGVQ